MDNYTHYYMSLALNEAKKAAQMGEVPVGAVIVWGDTVIGVGYNRRETDQSALGHAELMAIAQACASKGSWRLDDCDLYVTLEPCPMCSGAIINARIRRVIYGAKDEKAGCCGSIANFFAMPFCHTPQITCGVMEEECSRLLKDFFITLRSPEHTKI